MSNQKILGTAAMIAVKRASREIQRATGFLELKTILITWDDDTKAMGGGIHNASREEVIERLETLATQMRENIQVEESVECKAPESLQ